MSLRRRLTLHIINVFSRYVPGWLLADCESATLAEKLVRETCLKQGTLPDQLTLHSDRGSSMKSKPLAMPALCQKTSHCAVITRCRVD